MIDAKEARERCSDCIALVEVNGKWVCDEQGKEIENVKYCPEVKESEKIKAKFVRKIENGGAWYFDKYEFECVDCGTHFYSGRYDCRTSPYCAECKMKHDRKRTQELKLLKKRKHDRKIRNKAIEEFAEEAMERFTEFDLKHGYPTVTDCKMILREIAGQMKGVGE